MLSLFRYSYDKIPLNINSLQGKIIPIDSMNVIYKLMKNFNHYSTNDFNNYHIFSLFRFSIDLIKNNLLSIFVFDSPRIPKQKIRIVKQRNEQINEQINEQKYLLSDSTKTFKLTGKKILECKQLLKLMGLPVVESICESDQECANISNYFGSNCAGVITDDFDILMYGANILKNFSFRDMKTMMLDKYEIYEHLLNKANDIRKNNDLECLTEITHEKFVTYCVLTCTNYTTSDGEIFKIKNISQEKLFEICVMNDFKIKNISLLLLSLGLIEDVSFPEKWNEILNMYLHPTVIEPDTINIIPTGINQEELLKFLEEHNVNINYAKHELNKIQTQYMILQKIYSKNIYGNTSNRLSYYSKMFNVKKHMTHDHLYAEMDEKHKPFYEQNDRFDSIQTSRINCHYSKHKKYPTSRFNLQS